MIYLFVLISVTAFVWLFSFKLTDPSSKIYVIDAPTDRSLHNIPKPRTGGVPIFLSIFISWLIIAITQNMGSFIFYILAGLFSLALISYFDDRNSIPQFWRLLVHLLAAILMLVSGIGQFFNDVQFEGYINYAYLFNTIVILSIVWCVNLYNFMDGMDGLACGMGVIGFGCFALLGLLAGNDLFSIMASIVVAANLGFLPHNFPPAKIFLGDIGSITMGYLAAFFSLWGIQVEIFVWWAPILLFSPFIVDATVTLIRRLLSGEKIWEAHRSHHYQKLVIIGWGHKKTAICEYFLMISIAGSVIAMHVINSDFIIISLLAIWSLIYMAIIIYISRLSEISEI